MLTVLHCAETGEGLTFGSIFDDSIVPKIFIENPCPIATGRVDGHIRFC